MPGKIGVHSFLPSPFFTTKQAVFSSSTVHDKAFLRQFDDPAAKVRLVVIPLVKPENESGKRQKG